MLKEFTSALNGFERHIVESSKPMLSYRLKDALEKEAIRVANEFVLEFIERVEVKAEKTSEGKVRFIFEVETK